MNLKKDGKLDAWKVVKQIDKSPGRATKFLKGMANVESADESFSPSETVALMSDMKLTRDQYNILRAWMKKKEKSK